MTEDKRIFMKQSALILGIPFCSDTCYTFSGAVMNVYLSDTCCLTDRVYLSLVAHHRGHLDTAFHLRGLNNVILDFGGATLLLHGRIQPFIIDECENITIRNVTVAYDRAFYSEFDVP